MFNSIRKSKTAKGLVGLITPLVIASGIYFSNQKSTYADNNQKQTQEEKSFFEENKDNPLVNALDKLSNTKFGKGVENLRKKIIDEWAIKQGTGKTINELQDDAKKALKEFIDTINRDEPKDESIVRYILCGEEKLPTNHQDPCWSPDGKKIAFVSQLEDRRVLYVLDLGSSNFENLTHKNLVEQKKLVWFNKSIWDAHPSWSPDGNKIAFISTRGTIINPYDLKNQNGDVTDLYIIDSNGHNLRNLTNNRVVEEDPCWSPDGKKIAFVAEGDIYTINTDGGGLERLTRTPVEERHPCWSPDGKKIAFTSSRNGRYSENGNLDLCIMNADGTEMRELTRGQIPSWSPDGTRIAFVERDQLYIIDTYGDEIKKLTDAPGWVRDPAWSPDGKEIMFTLSYSSKKGGNFLDKEEVFFIKVPPFKPKRRLEDTLVKLGNLTDRSKIDIDPSWSPDGKKIAFVSNRDGNHEIYVMNADGSNIKRLTNNPAEERIPSWSPDGKKITFASNRNEEHGVYVMNADGSDIKKLTKYPREGWAPSWSPNGKKIAYVAKGGNYHEVFVMNVDGSDVKKITMQFYKGGDENKLHPSWSPDSKKIVFAGKDEVMLIIHDVEHDVDEVGRHSARDIMIPNWYKNNKDPSWSPDGKKIVFVAENDVYTINTDGKGLERLTYSPEKKKTDPCWSPDGKKITFTSDKDGSYRIYVMESK